VLANHRTLIDPILVQTAFPFRRMNSIATKDLFSSPAKEKFFTLMNCIKIDKDNFSTSSFHEIVERLGENKLVVIFPEGEVHVGSGHEILAFKSGVVLMAHRSGAPVIPLYVAEKRKWYHRQHMVMGQAVDIRWSKADRNTPLNYTLADGTPLTMKAGTSYVCIVANDSAVTIE